MNGTTEFEATPIDCKAWMQTLQLQVCSPRQPKLLNRNTRIYMWHMHASSVVVTWACLLVHQVKLEATLVDCKAWKKTSTAMIRFCLYNFIYWKKASCFLVGTNILLFIAWASKHVCRQFIFSLTACSLLLLDEQCRRAQGCPTFLMAMSRCLISVLGWPHIYMKPTEVYMGITQSQPLETWLIKNCIIR